MTRIMTRGSDMSPAWRVGYAASRIRDSLATRMAFRTFPSDVEELAKSWRQLVLTNLEWEIAGKPGEKGGEAESFFVRSGEVGGYAKPGKDRPPVADHPRAAHEKIASDLAFDLELPLPPVVLWQRHAPSKGQEKYLSVSAIAFEPAYKWGEIQKWPTAQRVLQALAPIASAMAPFDTWLGNTDRYNQGNVIAQEDVSAPQPLVRSAYIDYANSLSLAWMNGAWKDDRPVQCYPPGVALDASSMGDTIERIRDLKAEVIRDVVQRIPAGFLTDGRRAAITDGLLERQPRIQEILRKVYPGIL